MRKVFLSTMFLGSFEPQGFISEDFDLGNSNYRFPLSYLIEKEVEDGDEILVASVVQANEPTLNKSQENSDEFKAEVQKLLAGKKVKVEYQDVVTSRNFVSNTFNAFFKIIADLIQEEDRLYMDITFGMKPYSFSMFIAASYAVSVCEDVDVEYVIYSQKYTGNEEEEKNQPAKIFDITSLFYLNSLVNDARTGNRAAMDQLLKTIID